jgi:hypothetical protein
MPMLLRSWATVHTASPMIIVAPKAPAPPRRTAPVRPLPALHFSVTRQSFACTFGNARAVTAHSPTAQDAILMNGFAKWSSTGLSGNCAATHAAAGCAGG